MSRVVNKDMVMVLYGLLDDGIYTISSCFNKYGKDLGVSISSFYAIVRLGIKDGLFNSFNSSVYTLIKKQEAKE